MKVFQGSSTRPEGGLAVDEATSGWPETVDMLFVFHSTRQDASEVAAALARRFPGARMAGCTAAGEHLSGRDHQGALVVAAVVSPRTRWNVTVCEGLATFGVREAEAARARLLSGLDTDVEDLDPARHFCVTFMDGLSGREEAVAAAMSEALAGIPLVGGSAGDDLQFRRTQVIADGRAYDGAAVFVLGECADGFRILKHHHFAATRRYLAVTQLGNDGRQVRELDGRPAALSYAQALGLPLAAFTKDVAFAHPLILESNGGTYVRAIRDIGDDGTLSLFCGVEVGTVLSVAEHLPMVDTLRVAVAESRAPAALLLACHCFLRTIESGRDGEGERLSELLHRMGDCVIGFDTYGEQLDGQHANQSIVGIALGLST